MKRIIIHISIAVLAFLIGSLSTAYYHFQSEPMSQVDCSWPKRVAGKSGYEILNTKSTLGEDVDFYYEFTSPEVTSHLFQSNSEGLELIEKGPKLNEKGRKIGERGINVFPTGTTRIFWTEGEHFWFIQAPSLRLARKIESQCALR